MKKHFATDWDIVLGWPPTDGFLFFFLEVMNPGCSGTSWSVGLESVLCFEDIRGEFSSISTLTCCQQEGRPVALPNRRGEFITT